MISSIAQDFWATIAENSFQFRGNFSRDFCPRFNYHRVQRPKSQARVLEPSCIDLPGNKTRLATMRVVMKVMMSVVMVMMVIAAVLLKTSLTW